MRSYVEFLLKNRQRNLPEHLNLTFEVVIHIKNKKNSPRPRRARFATSPASLAFTCIRSLQFWLRIVQRLQSPLLRFPLKCLVLRHTVRFLS